MSVDRRRGAECSATRALLIDAAEELIGAQGFAAVSARKVASQAGLKPQLVHYYFRTMDDLLVAVIRRSAERNLERLVKALAAEQPLRGVWTYSRDVKSALLSMQFLALASHRPAIRAEVKRYGEQVRIVLTAALERHYEIHGFTPEVPPLVTALAMMSVSHVLILEEALGISLGHSETRAFIEKCLRRLEECGVYSAHGPTHESITQLEPPQASHKRKAAERSHSGHAQSRT
jgi:AcrR family transcriptional regulator